MKTIQNNANIHLKTKLTFTILVISCFAVSVLAQVEPAVDSNQIQKPLLQSLDSVPTPQPQIPNNGDIDILQFQDSIPTPSDTSITDFSQITFSKDSLDAPVDYSAVDSMIYDISNKQIHLFGQAEVMYTTISLKADHIVLNWETSIVEAQGRPDSTGQLSGIPEFQDGEQTFKAERMRYNFQTRKGVVYDVTTTQSDIVVHGSKSKFVSTEKADGDSTSSSNDFIYSSDAIFTTCTHEDPHFGVRSKKQKVIPNKLVVVGPSNLEIMGVPTPLWLPFGFFPLTQGRKTGLLFPRDYEYSQQWGFGIKDIGWFFPLGDNFNLSVTGNIYLKGTWGINAYSQYKKRYKYNGNLRLGYDVRRSEDNEGNITRPKSFGITWSHNQDRTAHPTVTFGGSVNLQTNNFQSRVYNDARSVLQNQINSNLRFQKNWTDKPINLTASFSHSQNTQSRNVTISFPTLNFQTQTLYPFKKKVRSGPEKWYETITMRYKGEAKNQFQATDTTLFTSQTLKDAQYGIRHDVTTGTSFKLFKYFSLNPGVTYKEVWYFNTLQKEFDPTPEVTIDTIYDPQDSTIFQEVFDTTKYGSVEDIRKFGFESYRQFSASLGLNTQLFGTLQFKKGWLRGIRHVAKPSISMSFSPDYLNPNLGYFDEVQTDLRTPDELDRYSIFEGNIFGSPPESGRQMSLNYSLNNIFEAKYFSKRDSTEKKLKLFNNILMGGSYNFAADSLKWTPVSMSGTTRLFKGMSTLSLRATFDPYIQDENGRRINKTTWRENGKLLRFDQASANFNTRITVGKIRALFMGKEEEVVEDVREDEEERRQERRPKETDFLSLFENFNISHNLSMRLDRLNDGRDSFRIATNSINMQGRIQLTDNWKINIGNFGYDFVNKGFSYPSVGFTRDLHCWEMGMNWAPTRGTYSFFIAVKPGSLDFIKIPYDRNNADARRAFQ